jgi:hypothetical protein
VTSVSVTPTRLSKIIAVIFFAEMALSPVLAAVALVVPVTAHWEAYKYVPTIVWLLILAQCLITFRWRGLWFLLGFPIAFVAIEAFLVAAPPVQKIEAQSAYATPPSLIRENPDGTLTVQKEPAERARENRDSGLRIPPQVIAPIAPAPKKTSPGSP